jgi:hypothetical protein
MAPVRASSSTPIPPIHRPTSSHGEALWETKKNLLSARVWLVLATTVRTSSATIHAATSRGFVAFRG